MSAVCPCCGGPLAGRVDPDVVARQMSSPLMAAIVRALAVRPMTYSELAWSVYKGREPKCAERTLIKTLCVYGHRLEPHGLRIERPGRGNRRALHLVQLGDRPAEVQE